MLSRMRALLNPTSLLTTVLCAGMALVMSMLGRGHAVGGAVPVIFLLAYVPTTLLAGRMASIVAAMVASFIFAAYLEAWIAIVGYAVGLTAIVTLLINMWK